jgi:ABC-type enterochelin transport system ATPase subunit
LSPSIPASTGKARTALRALWRNKALYLLLLPCLAYYFVFCYTPMYGAVIAFKDFSYRKGILGSPWVGLEHFRMLFSGEEALKPVNVLSGGERVRLMLARMMLVAGNLLLLDDPTNHLDLEAITALNKGMVNYRGVILFASHDHELIQTVANRIIYIKEKIVVDKYLSYDEFIEQYNI